MRWPGGHQADIDDNAADKGGELEGELKVARADMSLARPSQWPLRAAKLTPDPLNGFAQAFAQLDEKRRESAEVCVDLLPMRPSQVRRLRKRIERRDKGSGRANSGGPATADQIEAIAKGQPPRHGTRGRGATWQRRDPYAVGTVGARVTTRTVAEKTYSFDPFFRMQGMVRVTAPDKRRAHNQLMALIAAFGPWSGQNQFQQVGVHIGPVYLGGANAWWNRRWFDLRFFRSRFSPRKRDAVVSTTEIGGLFKPPTAKCFAQNVLRSGGVVPPPPRDLPVYKADETPELMPLGWVTNEEGDLATGVPWEDTVFTLSTGRSRFGKTEKGLGQFLAAAYAGLGCMFIDPHADAVARVKPYLTDPKLRDRVIEINLSPRGRRARQASWNLFDMQARTAEDIEAKVSAVVESFASTLRWGELNNRAQTLTTMTAQALCELALILPPELAPTLFQMTTLLSSESWREAVVPFLSPSCQEFWTERFGGMPKDAILPVTNLVDRLRTSATVAAMFGSSMSTYDIRAAMDAGKIVLACPSSGGDKNRLVANFFIYDLLHALLSRQSLDLADRRPFHVWIDEIQSVDGASSGNLADLLEQSAKYGGRLHAMLQAPSRLTDLTLEAMLTNRSHLFTTTVAARDAKLLAEHWGGKVRFETLTDLAKYQHVGAVTIGGRPTKPFKVRGFELSEMWGSHCHPELLDKLEAAIDHNIGRRPVGEILAELDSKNRLILGHLQGLHPGPRPSSTARGNNGGGPRLHAVGPTPRLGR